MKNCAKTQWGHLPKRARQADEIILELEKARLGEKIPSLEFDRIIRGGIELCDALLEGMSHTTSMEAALMADGEALHSATFCQELKVHGAGDLLKEEHIAPVKQMAQDLKNGVEQSTEDLEIAKLFFLKILTALNNRHSAPRFSNIW